MRSIGIFVFVLVLGLSAAARGSNTNAPTRDPVIARVFDRDIKASEEKELSGIVFGSLLQKFTEENAIAPTQAEIDSFVERSMQQKVEHRKDRDAKRLDTLKKLESTNLSDADRNALTSNLQLYNQLLKLDAQIEDYDAQHPGHIRKTEEKIARHFVQSWKVNLALYKQYGGRVIFQQAGVEPLDAFRDFLTDQEKAGHFQIIDKQYEAAFWNYFTNDAMHSFYPKEEGNTFMTTPWWLMSNPREK